MAGLTPKGGSQAPAPGQWGKWIILSQENFLVFFNMSVVRSSCLKFHLFCHLLCLEYPRHSATLMDQMDDLGNYL